MGSAGLPILEVFRCPQVPAHTHPHSTPTPAPFCAGKRESEVGPRDRILGGFSLHTHLLPRVLVPQDTSVNHRHPWACVLSLECLGADPRFRTTPLRPSQRASGDHCPQSKLCHPKGARDSTARRGCPTRQVEGGPPLPPERGRAEQKEMWAGGKEAGLGLGAVRCGAGSHPTLSRCGVTGTFGIIPVLS